VGHARLVDRALLAGELPDAIVAYNDMHAFTIMSALRSRGFEPGRDVSVASFDNVPEAAQQYPSLTTADGFPTRVGAAATEMVLDSIAEGSSHILRHTLIQPELRVRQSTTLSTLSAALPTA
jgi:LacI family transcriptional regulator